ncbi:MAG: hypothetical protein MZW92_26710 [Comamonadaceae bacterium]|nr:hypothetical protein [Comamonadaceae bacterium]
MHDVSRSALHSDHRPAGRQRAADHAGLPGGPALLRPRRARKPGGRNCPTCIRT